MRSTGILLGTIMICLLLFTSMGTDQTMTAGQVQTSFDSLEHTTNHTRGTQTDQESTEVAKSTEFANQSLPLDHMAYNNGTGEIPVGGSHTFGAVPQSTNLMINYDRSYNDTLGYRGNFSKFLDSGIGTLDVYYSSESQKTKVRKQNTGSKNSYDIFTNRVVRNGSYLNISLSDLEFTITDNEFGHFNLDFYFDSIKISIIYNATSTYEESLENSTNEIIILRERLGNSIVNITELVTAVDGYYPSKLNQLTLFVYGNVEYNLSATFDQIMLMVPYDIAQTDIDLHAGQVYQIQIPSSVQTSFYWVREIENRIFYEFSITQSNQILYATTKQEHKAGITGFTYYYKLPSWVATFTIKGNTTVYTNETGFWYDWQQFTTWQLRGELTYKKEDISSTMPLQGSQISLSVPERNWTSFYLYHPQIEQLITHTNQSSTVFDIPRSWPKGSIIGYGITEEGYYSRWDGNLPYSPSKLVSDTRYQFSTTQHQVIPVTMLNMTSGEEIRPTRIISRVNGSTWQVSNKYGIIISAGDFQPGRTNLEINATRPGMVPIVAIIQLDIRLASISPEISTQRQAADRTLLSVTVPELSNWSVGLVLNITGEQINRHYTVSTPYNQFILNHPDWEGDSEYQLQLHFSINYELGEFNYTTLVGVVAVPNDQGQFNTGELLITTIGILGITGTLGIKVYKSKFSNDTINF